jgi:hypothetical protein
MSAAEIIEQIEKLPPEEQAKVSAFLRTLEQRHTGRTPGKVSEEIKRAAEEVFTMNAELFRKLAK